MVILISIKASSGNSALCAAAAQGHLDVVKYLYEAGASVLVTYGRDVSYFGDFKQSHSCLIYIRLLILRKN
jgi:ankyrin repeat protein